MERRRGQKWPRCQRFCAFGDSPCSCLLNHQRKFSAAKLEHLLELVEVFWVNIKGDSGAPRFITMHLDGGLGGGYGGFEGEWFRFGHSSPKLISPVLKVLPLRVAFKYDTMLSRSSSSYREMLIEHLFAAAVMRDLWLRGYERLEMLQSQVDNSGYDIVLETSAVVRHIQLKNSFRGATTNSVSIKPPMFKC